MLLRATARAKVAVLEEEQAWEVLEGTMIMRAAQMLETMMGGWMV